LFQCSTYCPNSFKHLSQLSTNFLMQKQCWGQPHQSSQQNFFDHKQISYTNHALMVLQNTCHHKPDTSQSEWHLHQITLPQKTNGSLWDGDVLSVTSLYLMSLNHVKATSSNKTHSWYSVINSLQNVYFGFFIF